MDRIFAAFMLAACIGMLVRLCLGEQSRARLARTARRWQARWRGSRPEGLFASSAHRQAERAAQEAIRRARERAAGEWDGNVYKAKSFRKGQGKRKIH